MDAQNVALCIAHSKPSVKFTRMIAHVRGLISIGHVSGGKVMQRKMPGLHLNYADNSKVLSYFSIFLSVILPLFSLSMIHGQ